VAILGEHNWMAKAYSNDLRRKLLEAYDRGEGSLRVLAERFGVSSPYAWKISAQRKRTGQVERVEQRHGPESKVTEAVEEQLRSWVRQQPDLTLVEIQERLWETARLPVSVARVWQVLRRMKLRLKKSHSTPRSKTRRRISGGGRRGGKR
jgi:transposase